MNHQAGALRREDIEVVIDRRSVYFGIELDNDYLPAPYEHGGWNDLLGEVLVEFTGKHPKSGPLTVWTGMLPSTNFFHQSYSSFIIAAGGNENLKAQISQTLSARIGSKFVRNAEGISGSEVANWNPSFHIEAGRVWRPLDESIWFNWEIASQDSIA